MARPIRSTSEAAGPIVTPQIPPGGVTFANNNPNRMIPYGTNPDGTPKQFTFGKFTRLVFTDPDKIAAMDRLSQKDGSVFRIDPPAAPEPAPTVPAEPSALDQLKTAEAELAELQDKLTSDGSAASASTDTTSTAAK